MQIALDGRQSLMWTAMPGFVTKVNLSENTVEVQVTLTQPVTDEAGDTTQITIKPLLDVPLVFPNAGGFALTFPVAVNDEVLVVFASRCIDAWWQSGGVQKPMENRMHDLSDGFAIPGVRSKPNALASISATKVQLRNNAGTVYFQVGTKFAMKNAVTDLKTALKALTLALTTFGTAITPADLAVRGTALASAITTPVTGIDALLDALLEST